MPDTSSATAMLIGLRSRSLDEEDEEADWLGMLADDADDVRDEDWLPKAGADHASSSLFKSQHCKGT